MALPVLRASGATRTTSNSTTGSLTIPAAVQPGDWGLLAFTSSSNVVTFTGPTGWSTVIAPTNVGTAMLAVYAKQYQAGDAAPTTTSSGGTTHILAGSWYSGSNGIGVVGSLSINGATTTTVTAPGITTTGADNLVATIFAFKGNATATPTSITVTPDTTTDVVQYGTGLSSPGAWVGEFNRPTAGATNAQTATLDSATASAGGIQISLIPVPAPQVWVPTTDTGSTVTGWTKTPSGAASVAAVLADNDPLTYIESGDNPNNLVYQSAAFTLAKPADLTSVKVKASGYLAAGTTGSRLIQLYQGTTLIKQQTVALTGSNVETVVSLNSTEAGSITVTTGQWANLSVKVTDTAS